MKEQFLLAIPLLLLLGCAASDTYSFQGAVGLQRSNIESIMVSASVHYSYAWTVSEETYAYLDTSYIKTDFDILEEFGMTSEGDQGNDDAYVLHITFDDTCLNESGGRLYLTFYVSHTTRYMYFEGVDSAYHSVEQMPDSFISLINDVNDVGAEGI